MKNGFLSKRPNCMKSSGRNSCITRPQRYPQDIHTKENYSTQHIIKTLAVHMIMIIYFQNISLHSWYNQITWSRFIFWRYHTMIDISRLCEFIKLGSKESSLFLRVRMETSFFCNFFVFCQFDKKYKIRTSRLHWVRKLFLVSLHCVSRLIFYFCLILCIYP